MEGCRQETVPASRVGPWQATRVASMMYRTHRRPPALPWHPSATAAVGFFSTIAGAAYATPEFDAVAIVWRVTPAGLASAVARILAGLSVPPILAGVVTRSRAVAVVVVAAESMVIGTIGIVYEMSSRHARKHWLAKPGHERPPKENKIPLLRAGHLVGLGVAAEAPHAADAICRSIADHADLPVYLVASTPAHARLFKRFGFERAGPSAYGETPMVRPAGQYAGTLN